MINNSTSFDTSIDGGVTNYNASLTGNFTNNGVFTARNKSVTFNGISTQSISGSATSNFYNLTINNSSLTGITLTSPITIDGNLTLTDGNIYTSSINSITLNSGASSSSGSENSYVDGPFTKIGTSDFIFPLGNNSKWSRIGISNLTGNETFTANYTKSCFSNTSSYNPETNPLGSVSKNEYWSLNKLGSTQANVQLFWENASQSSITDCAELKIAFWNNSNSYWEKANNSDAVSINGSCSGTNFGSIYTTTPLSNFGIFTFGNNGFVSLPISLISFKVLSKKTFVELNWETVSEKNNDYFTIEKTKDGITYEFIEQIKGSGTHFGLINYKSVDYSPNECISYYRLTQTDFDGKKISYPLISVLFENLEDLSIQCFPNPFRKVDDLHLQIQNQLNQDVSYSIFNNSGESIKSESLKIKNQNEEIIIKMEKENPNGIYYIQLVVNNVFYSKKIVLQD